MAEWFWWLLTNALIAAAGLTLLGLALFAAGHYYYRTRFLHQIVRIFEEKPLFIVPKGKPIPAAEDFTFASPDGLKLCGCYLKAAGPRKGVVLFAPEFGSNRWAVGQYCGDLVDAGYDVFAYEPRNQGESETDPEYSPLQWVVDKDLVDAKAAVAYLKKRPDAPPEGIGIFGISKGGSVGMAMAAEDAWVRCIVTDGAYAAYTTMVPYMRRWVQIYSPYRKLQDMLPGFFYGSLGIVAMARSASRRGVHYVSLESKLRRLRQPLLMIHGGADAYIKPEMAETLFRKVRSRVKDLWIVPKAKHNQALHVAGDGYTRRIVSFFDSHLSPASAEDADAGEVLAPAAGRAGAAGSLAAITRMG